MNSFQLQPISHQVCHCCCSCCNHSQGCTHGKESRQVQESSQSSSEKGYDRRCHYCSEGTLRFISPGHLQLFKYNKANYQIASKDDVINAHLKKALRDVVVRGQLELAKGTGAARSLRLGEKKVEKKPAMSQESLQPRNQPSKSCNQETSHHED